MSLIPPQDDPHDDPWGWIDDPLNDDNGLPDWPEVEVTENPVVHELLGPDGEVIRQWRERPPFGFQPGGDRA